MLALLEVSMKALVEWFIGGIQTGAYYWMEWLVGLVGWAILLIVLYAFATLIIKVFEGDDDEN